MKLSFVVLLLSIDLCHSAGDDLLNTEPPCRALPPVKGPKGNKGDTGPQGVQGIRGAQGIRGVTGVDGPVGAQGPEGIQGVVGPAGPTGPTGSNGIDGKTIIKINETILDGVKKDIKKLDDETNTVIKEIVYLREDQQDFKKEVKRLDAFTTDLMKGNDKLEDKLKMMTHDLRGDHEQMIDDMQDVQRKLHDMKRQADDMRAEMRSNTAQSNQDRDEMSYKVKTLQKSIDKLTSSTQGVEKDLNLKLKTISDELNNLKVAIEKNAGNAGNIGKFGERMMCGECKLDADLVCDCTHKYPRVDCTAHMEAGAKSGVYKLRVNKKEFNAFCDMETIDSKGVVGGWTVLQRRKDGMERFNRTLKEYAFGFGDVRKDHWLGLENMHLITSSGKYMVQFNMRKADGQAVWTSKAKFVVSSAAKKYQLNIEGTHKGTTKDKFEYTNWQRFSTIDSDNDDDRGSCAQEHGGGGWWYKKCGYVFLNGKYYIDGKANNLDGIHYKGLSSNNVESLVYTDMKIKRTFYYSRNNYD